MVSYVGAVQFTLGVERGDPQFGDDLVGGTVEHPLRGPFRIVGVGAGHAPLHLAHRRPHARLLGGELPGLGVQVIEDGFVG